MDKKCKSDHKLHHLWESWASVEYSCLPHLLSELCEAQNCPSNKRICRTEVCEEIQAVPSHLKLSESAWKPSRKKTTFKSHNCFWCSVLVKVSVGLTQALMVPSAPSPPHCETPWHILKRKKILTATLKLKLVWSVGLRHYGAKLLSW